ncbi:MAG: GntR family transcriptional regulator [Planctomycetota bacterium]
MHRYQAIRAELLRRINNQTWPAGHVIPHEEELATSFGVARGTIRRALGSLVDAGLLERKRRAGTRVARPTAHASTLRIAVVRHEVEARGGSYGYRLIESREGGGELDAGGRFGGAALRRVLCLHCCDGSPFQLEDRLLNLAAIPAAREANFAAISPNEWLVAEQPYSAVRTVLRAAAPSADDLVHLAVGASQPVFVIERQTRLLGEPLTWARLSHPGAAFEIVTEAGGY